MEAPEIFKTAPREVTRYFEAKENRPTFDWRKVAPEEHAFTFTVAKSAGFDILDDIRASVSEAITNRVPFEEFRHQLAPVLVAKGWWGKKAAIDPDTGEEKLVQLGSPRRLRTIYWANTRTAFAAGEWERTQRTKDFLPFLVYELSTAERKRLEHKRWVGIVALVDHPIWDRLYPPNGWGCKCRIRQITRREAVSLGWREDEPVTVLTEKPWTNKRTGKTVMVPEGIDPGWDTNPGKLRAGNVSRFLEERLATMPPARQRIAIEDIVQSPILGAMAAGKMPKAFLPVAQLPGPIVGAFEATSPIVRLSASSLSHILHDHHLRGLGVEDIRSAISVLVRPSAVIRRPGVNSAIVMGTADGQWWRLAVKLAGGGSEWWLQSFLRKSADEARKVIERAGRAGHLLE